jgi:hypothetical protein
MQSKFQIPADEERRRNRKERRRTAVNRTEQNSEEEERQTVRSKMGRHRQRVVLQMIVNIIKYTHISALHPKKHRDVMSVRVLLFAPKANATPHAF